MTDLGERIKGWLMRFGWQPDGKVQAAKDARVKRAHRTAIWARKRQERTLPTVNNRLSRVERLADAMDRAARARG